MAHQTAQYRHRVRVPRLEDPAFHPLCADRQLEDQAVQIAHNRNPALHRNTKTELTRAERMIPRKHDVPNSAFAARRKLLRASMRARLGGRKADGVAVEEAVQSSLDPHGIGIEPTAQIALEALDTEDVPLFAPYAKQLRAATSDFVYNPATGKHRPWAEKRLLHLTERADLRRSRHAAARKALVKSAGAGAKAARRRVRARGRGGEGAAPPGQARAGGPARALPGTAEDDAADETADEPAARPRTAGDAPVPRCRPSSTRPRARRPRARPRADRKFSFGIMAHGDLPASPFKRAPCARACAASRSRATRPRGGDLGASSRGGGASAAVWRRARATARARARRPRRGGARRWRGWGGSSSAPRPRAARRRRTRRSEAAAARPQLDEPQRAGGRAGGTRAQARRPLRAPRRTTRRLTRA